VLLVRPHADALRAWSTACWLPGTTVRWTATTQWPARSLRTVADAPPGARRRSGLSRRRSGPGRLPRRVHGHAEHRLDRRLGGRVLVAGPHRGRRPIAAVLDRGDDFLGALGDPRPGDDRQHPLRLRVVGDVVPPVPLGVVGRVRGVARLRLLGHEGPRLVALDLRGPRGKTPRAPHERRGRAARRRGPTGRRCWARRRRGARSVGCRGPRPSGRRRMGRSGRGAGSGRGACPCARRSGRGGPCRRGVGTAGARRSGRGPRNCRCRAGRRACSRDSGSRSGRGRPWDERTRRAGTECDRGMGARKFIHPTLHPSPWFNSPETPPGSGPWPSCASPPSPPRAFGPSSG
jgi:hypothetical protein